MFLYQFFLHTYVNESTNINLASGLRPCPQGTSSQFEKSFIKGGAWPYLCACAARYVAVPGL